MKNILLRTGMLPTECYGAKDFLFRNLMAGNIGNLLYTNSILRNIITGPNFNIQSNRYDYEKFTPGYVNKNFDCFIIPLADAFREDFMDELNTLTNFIKKLKIPCYVIGVGLRDKYEPTFKNGFSFDKDVKKFISAVLDKSSIVGVRGQITADYLSQLGFKEGRDHTVIGCPSMYNYGPNLHVEKPLITTNSRISLNASLTAPDVVKNLLTRTAKEIPNYTFVPQTTRELKYLYTGISFKHNDEYIPYDTDSPLFEGNHCMFMLSPRTWFNYFKNQGIELSVGSRLHGNVAALLTGVPAIFLLKDARERELNDVHHFNSFPTNELTEKTTIWELIEKSDFSCFEKYQLENYRNFVNFLDKNGIPHVDQTVRGKVPFTKYIKDVEVKRPVRSFRAVSEKQRGIRLRQCCKLKDRIVD